MTNFNVFCKYVKMSTSKVVFDLKTTTTLDDNRPSFKCLQLYITNVYINIIMFFVLVHACDQGRPQI